MSDTPITDAFIIQNHVYPIGYHAMISTSRALERELNAANSIIRQQQLLEEENLGLRQHIKRLEEAGDAMAEYLASGVDVDNWTAAKETKP
jgi:hypothetical protein